jgi:hypothetical protein
MRPACRFFDVTGFKDGIEAGKGIGLQDLVAYAITFFAGAVSLVGTRTY